MVPVRLVSDSRSASPIFNSPLIFCVFLGGSGKTTLFQALNNHVYRVQVEHMPAENSSFVSSQRPFQLLFALSRARLLSIFCALFSIMSRVYLSYENFSAEVVERTHLESPKKSISRLICFSYVRYLHS
jgi:hypothetical protein